MSSESQPEATRTLRAFFSKYLGVIISLTFTLLLVSFFAAFWYFWKANEHRYICKLEGGKVLCVDEAGQKIVEPEHLFALPQKQELYKGDGITIVFAGNGAPDTLTPVTVPKASTFNFDQPAHRKLVDAAALEFTGRVAKFRNSKAPIETLLIIADFTSGTDDNYRAKLGSYLQNTLTRALNEGYFTEIHIYAAMSTPELHSLGLTQVVSSSEGVTEFLRNLPTQIPDSKDLPFSPLVESLWTILKEFTQTPNLAVLFFSDLEQNTKTVSFIQGKNRDLLTNPQQLGQIADRLAQDFGARLPVPKLKHFEFLAMPKSERTSYQQLQPFWLAVVSKNGISRDNVEFEY